MPNDPLYFDLLEACALPGCPVCRLVQASLQRTIRNFFFESVNDIASRAELRRSLGFCREHTEMALQPGLGDALGFAIIYNDVFKNLLRRLPGGLPAEQPKGGLASLFGQAGKQVADRVKAVKSALTPHAPCPICTQRDTFTRLAFETLWAHLAGAELQGALRSSSGLCLPHLRGALEQATAEATASVLLAIEGEKLESLRLELEEIIRKHDYRFREEAPGSERDAWQRAARMAVGEPPGKPG